jgi:hypothetical protein
MLDEEEKDEELIKETELKVKCNNNHLLEVVITVP